MAHRTPAKPERDDEVHARIMAEVPGLRVKWDATEPKRRIALFLVAMRSKAGLSQSDIAKRAGWDKAFVSRLEGALGSMPSLETLSRYADACDHELGLVSGAWSSRSVVHIDAAMTFHREAGETAAPTFERLTGQDLDVADTNAEESQAVYEP